MAVTVTSVVSQGPALGAPGQITIWKSTLFTNPPFLVICLSYACHMNTSVISFSICHMPGIFLSQTNSEKMYLVYPNFKKDLPNLKKMLLAYTKGIFADPGLHVPVICRSYPCHKSVLFCGLWQTNKIMPAIELWVRFLNTTTQCSSSTTRFICFRRLCGNLSSSAGSSGLRGVVLRYVVLRGRWGRRCRRPAASVVLSCAVVLGQPARGPPARGRRGAPARSAGGF